MASCSKANFEMVEKKLHSYPQIVELREEGIYDEVRIERDTGAAIEFDQ